MKIRINVDKLLEEKGLTRYYLVKNMNTRYNVIDNILNNDVKSIRLETIWKLCTLLACEPNDLFTIGNE